MEQNNNKQVEIKKQVDTIETTIKQGEKELEQIRKDCNHPAEKISIKNICPGVGASDYRKVCGVCGQNVGYPSPQQIESEVGGTSNSTK